MTLIDTSAWVEFFRKKGRRDIKAGVAGYIHLGVAAYCGPVQVRTDGGRQEVGSYDDS